MTSCLPSCCGQTINGMLSYTLVRVTFTYSDWILFVSRCGKVGVIRVGRFRRLDSAEIDSAAQSLTYWGMPTKIGPQFSGHITKYEPNLLSKDHEHTAREILSLPIVADWYSQFLGEQAINRKALRAAFPRPSGTGAAPASEN